MFGFAPANHPQVALAVVASVSQPCNVAPVTVSAFTGGT